MSIRKQDSVSKKLKLKPKKVIQEKYAQIHEGGSNYNALNNTELSKNFDVTVDDQLGYLEASGLAHQVGAEGNTHGSGFPLSLQGIQPSAPVKRIKREEKPKIAAANYGIMSRMESKLDTPSVFTDKQQVRTAKENMKDYMTNFGIEFPIPALFVIDSVIYPVNPTYSIQLIKYAFPISQNYSVSTHNLDGNQSIGSFENLFSQYTRGLVLRLLKRDQSSLLKIGEVALNAQHALMEFHHDGEMFAFYFQETQTLKITYIDDIDNFVDMLKSLEDTEHDDQYFVDFNGPKNNLDLSFIEKIKFDTGKKYLIGWGQTKVFIMNMEEIKGQVIEINERFYHSIYHCNIISSDLIDDDSYTFYIACQRNDVKQIVVFDLDEELALRQIHKTNDEPNSGKFHGQKLQSMMTLNYLEELSPDFKLMVSHDNQQVVFTNGYENSVLEVMEGGKYYNQRKLKHLKNKKVRHVQQDYKEGGFYFLACQEFDKYLSVEHSNRESFDIRFARLIEPGVIRIFDFHIKTIGKLKDGKKGFKKEIRVVSMRDDEFILDKCGYDEIAKAPSTNLKGSSPARGSVHIKFGKQAYLKEYEQTNDEYLYFIYSPLRAYSVQWPYVCLSGLANYVLIVNAYDKNVLRRIQVGSRDAKITISETFITETLDLYVLIQQDDLYRLYHIDLDASNQFEHDAEEFETRNQYKFNEVFAYTSESVKNQPIKQIHVRGSSAKDDNYDMNEKLQVLFLHGDDLYVWVQTHKQDTNLFQEMRWASKCTSALFKDKDQQVYFMHVEKNMETKKQIIQEIKRLDCLFSTFEITVIYKESGQSEKLKTINIDPEADKLIIFSRKTDDRGANLKRKNLMKILDYKDMRIIHESEVCSPELVGRLKTGLYTFSNGHIYYNNNCIKIRYDLLDNGSGEMLSEKDVLDLYLNCFDLKDNEKIRSGTPLDSQKNHRFVYIKRDMEMNEPSQILILPYLHERKIFLNTKKLATDYFYTSITTTVEQENLYRAAFNQVKDAKGNATDIDILEIMNNSGTVKLAKKKTFIEKAEVLSGSGSVQEETEAIFTSIICVKTTEFKYYVYSQNGVLINRVDFSNLVDAYGHPIQTSSNGQVFIFKKAQDQIEDMQYNGQYSKGELSSEQASEFATISIVKLTVFGMQHVKSINLQEALKDVLKNETTRQAAFMQENQWFMNSDYKLLQKHIKFNILVNDNMDVCVRISYNIDPEKPIESKLVLPQVDNQIYYYESILKNQGGPKQQNRGIFGSQDPELLSTLMLRTKNLNEKFVFNKKYLFIWDSRHIQYFNLGQKFDQNSKMELNFEIDEESIGSSIKDIRCGSNPANIVIIVQLNPKGIGKGIEKTIDTVIWWNMDKNAEEETYEIRDGYLVLWGSAGNPYIITESKVLFIKQRCAITAFDYEGAIEAFNQGSQGQAISVHKGHRVDGMNHNWLIFEEYLSLPFDYMTFVIKDKIENEDDGQLDNQFDPTPYNYVFNRATSFTEGDFVTDDHEQLLNVLTNLKRLGGDHIEIINYTNEVKIDGVLHLNSALHRAVDNGNQRSINYILYTMSHIDVNSSANYIDIISDLLDYEEFHHFLQHLPSQTFVMEEKQIFRNDEPVNDRIIKQLDKSSLFFTETFYEKDMKEQKNEQSHPVTVTALRIDWIINTEQGKDFLQNVLLTDNLDFFKIDTVQYVVEFLFVKFKGVIVFLLLPVFLSSHLSYFFLQKFNNEYNSELYDLFKDVQDPEDSIRLADIPMNETKKKVLTVAIVCVAAWSLQLIQVFVFIYFGGWNYFKKVYSQLDILYLTSVVATFYFMSQLHLKDDIKFSEFENIVKLTNQIGVVGYFSLYAKASYFLSLIDAVAPLIDIIFKIFSDIKWFMIVSFWYVLMFAQCYDLLAKNQIKFDNLTEAQKVSLPYSGIGPSMWFMIQVFLGGASTEGFYYGDKSQRIVLNTLFFFSTFLIITHFLNMLIAIMGNTFGERTEVQTQIMSRDHLRFVIDNFHLLSLAIREKNSLKYIITAALQPNDREMTDKEKGAWITEQFEGLEKKLSDKITKNTEFGSDTNVLVEEILKRVVQQEKKR